MHACGHNNASRIPMRPAAPQATPVATFSGWERAASGRPDAYFQVSLTVYVDAVPVEYVRLLRDSQVTLPAELVAPPVITSQ